ncbi:hypothetical protein [Pseudarthrobacter albicanus]|uniref:hypothetical protein n=1 Tax=Pseudarthrobacter albicanus TaxID=2823873 RepID=UPI001BA599FD|nr:hypothetical protein [Pseudarthrobacter albicanus]
MTGACTTTWADWNTATAQPAITPARVAAITPARVHVKALDDPAKTAGADAAALLDAAGAEALEGLWTPAGKGCSGVLQGGAVRLMARRVPGGQGAVMERISG